MPLALSGAPRRRTLRWNRTTPLVAVSTISRGKCMQGLSALYAITRKKGAAQAVRYIMDSPLMRLPGAKEMLSDVRERSKATAAERAKVNGVAK
jgi:hypothetical protein